MSTGTIRKVDSSGDTILAQWDTTDPDSVAAAEAAFKAEAAKGGVLSRCDEGTHLTGEQIREFDPDAGEILAFGRPVGG